MKLAILVIVALMATCLSVGCGTAQYNNTVYIGDFTNNKSTNILFVSDNMTVLQVNATVTVLLVNATIHDIEQTSAMLKSASFLQFPFNASSTHWYKKGV